MDLFFTTLKRSLVATIMVIFAFVIVYVPQTYEDRYETVQEAEAFVDLANLVYNTFQAVKTGGLWLKEFTLDGIGWAIAKAMVSVMLSNLINWVNSGFQGRPAFLTDLEGFLLEAADRGAGEYINSLSDIGSSICSPFQLDIQIILSLQYASAREDRPTGTCTLTGIIDNIESFYEGNFADGGWDDWFDITSRPEKYTELGQLYEAQIGIESNILKKQGAANSEVQTGNGFLSGKICRMIEGGGSPKEKCTITKPGTIVQNALSRGLDSSRESLVQADEINELIAALFGQIANRAITGAAGLLGLSGGTGYTYDGYNGGSFISGMTQESSAASSAAIGDNAEMFVEAIAVQNEYGRLAADYLPRLSDVAANASSSNQEDAADAVSEATAVIAKTRQDIPLITDLQTEYTTLTNELNTNATTYDRETAIKNRLSEILGEFNNLGTYSRQAMTSSETAWSALTS